jgi:hypothetical protein
MDKVLALLHFLRITDDNDRLSLTNLACAGSFIAMMLRPEIAVGDIATFAFSLAGYTAKRFATGAASSAEADTAAINAAVEKLQTSVTALQMSQQRQR